MLNPHVVVYILFYFHVIKSLIFRIAIPYRTKHCRTKLTKFWLGVEIFVRRKFCPTKIFSDKVMSNKVWL